MRIFTLAQDQKKFQQNSSRNSDESGEFQLDYKVLEFSVKKKRYLGNWDITKQVGC